MAASRTRAEEKALLLLTSGAALLALLATSASAQAVRIAGPNLSPQGQNQSLTVYATPAFVNFNLVSGGIASGSNAVAITTSWDKNSCSSGCTITLYAYFMSSGAALSGGSPAVNIPSSEILGQVPTGTPTSYTSFTQSSPLGGGGSLQLFQQSYIKHEVPTSRTDDLNLEIDLSGQPQMPAGTYTGTLYIEAESL
ncbi:MAG TPA: hypothetical protein VG206_09925 [Terriglobia bacterium]|nr:hypothetical protein [Terriglobia bacterium]